MDQILFVPTDVRLRLGRWGVGDAVLIERLITRQRWTASAAVAATLLAFSGGRTRREGAESATDALGVSQRELLRQIDRLTEIGLLAAEPSEPDQLADHWRRHGWSAAYDHHLPTWDFPLVDYATDGWKADQARMDRYRDREPDLGPLPHDYCAALPTALNLAEVADVELATPLKAVLHNTEVSSYLDSERLLILLAKTFCFSKKRALGKVRRTSPSGGGRHPAEGYAITQGVSGISDGVWHVDAARSRLVRVPGTVSPHWASESLEGLYLAPFTPQVLVVFTAVFARNMYRYREPRTFRTIFMDVGHLLGTLEMVASALGLRSFAHSAIDDTAVERMLGLSGWKEGVIAGAAIAGRT